ncbi:MAG: polysialyltransferase family glycosyltransferase [Sideroxyarcus sp.]|nr:polysialyltransferase family glycosyltransferase [Sideroxyarcus sp.]
MMIYFLVNNTYQLYDARLHLSTFQSSGFRVGLLEVPHSLENPNHSGFDVIYSFNPFQYKNFIRCWFNALSLRRILDQKIAPSKDDVLFLYTEYEPFNQLIATRFKNAGARVYLIEDGGFATYVPFRMVLSEPLTIKERMQEIVARACPGIFGLRFHKMNGIVFPWMKDALLDGVCLYRPVKIARRIDAILIKRPVSVSLNCIQDTVIFLNECIYDHYQSTEKYLSGLDLIVRSLCNGFSVVYFKFHPRELAEWRYKIQQEVLCRYKKLIIIQENVGIESVIEQYRPEVVASYFSAALLNLQEKGVEPLYLYHLIEELRDQPVYKIVTSILEDWGYRFPPDFSSVHSGYKSGIPFDKFNQGAISLLELVREYE